MIPNFIPEPYPLNYEDKWDPEHVKMPCSLNNLYPLSANVSYLYKNAVLKLLEKRLHNNFFQGNSSLEQRWKLIKEAFKNKITNSLELEKAILSYNSRYNQIWNFRGFHEFIDQVPSSPLL